MPSSARSPLVPNAVLLLLAAYACCMGGRWAATAQRAGSGVGYRVAPSVNIRRQGVVSGIEVPINKFRAWLYLGIPFARAPVGDLRFAPPDVDPPPTWDGVRNGSQHKPWCIQNPPTRTHPVRRMFASVAPRIDTKTSEDCLYLNIYRPEGAVPDEKFPVMVWFHPGDFQWGASSYWDATTLAAKYKVIVITTAYRLNILGFFTDNTALASGNWGLMDQSAALDWVQQNVDSFGGSPQNVTVFGQGSGAVSVGLHLLSPRSRDKFGKAISMSGNALLPRAVSEGPDDAVLEAIAEKFSCFKTTLHGCLKNVDADLLVTEGGPMFRWGPVVDGPALANDSSDIEPFLPAAPAALMDEGKFAAVPHMIGYNRMEDAFDAFGDGDGGDVTRERFEALVRVAVAQEEEERNRRQTQPPSVTSTDADFVEAGGAANEAENCTLDADFVVDTVMMRYARRTDQPDTLRRNYVTMTTNKVYGATAYRLAAYVAQYNNTYLYRYDYKVYASGALFDAADWMNATHGAELLLVWGMPYWPSAADVEWQFADRKMSDTMMAMWTNFAKYADPMYRQTVQTVNMRWEDFRPRNPRPMVLDKISTMLPYTDQESEFWNEYYPKVLDVSLHCCANYTAVESAAAASTLPHRIGLHVTLTMMLAVSFVISRYPHDL